MSHTVMRGEPYASQLYLDTILDEIRFKSQNGSGLRKRCEINLAEIIYHRMKQQSDDLFMINGATGEKITYKDIIQQAVPLARALQVQYETGTHVMFLMRNHEIMAAVYYASLFAGVLPLMTHPEATLHEILHFYTLVSPAIIFCDEDRYEDVIKITSSNCETKTVVLIAKDHHLEQFFKGYHEDLDSFKVLNASPETPVLLLPTSGSSGLPKATILVHKGIISQLSVIWNYLSQFPRPTDLALLLSTAQWMTHTILMTSCPVFGVTLLMTSQNPSIDHVLGIIEKYQPTWALLGPVFAKSLAASGNKDQLKSIKIIVTTGAPLTSNIMTALMENFPKSAHLCNGYGLTETHGFITSPNFGTPWYSNGKLMNTVLYKIVPENDVTIENKGELYVKSDFCIFKGYYNNEKAYDEMVNRDGWLMTGDIFIVDENEDLHYVERKKFWFKYLNHHIAPEELENVISSVPGVQECVVTDSEKGPVAAVVLRADFKDTHQKISKEIHEAVNATLSDYKHLRGGIVFVSSLPCTHSGKIIRRECKNLIEKKLKISSCN